MKSTRFYKIVISILVIINITTLVFLWLTFNHPMGPPPHPGRLDLVEKLGVEGENRAKIIALQDQHFKTKDSLIRKGRDLHERLYRFFNNSKKDSTDISQLIDQIVENQRKTEQITFDHFKAISELCTPEQRKLLDEIIHKVLSKRGPGGPPPPRK
jgi:Spy/CpxP family protein refolding chaperone